MRGPAPALPLPDRAGASRASGLCPRDSDSEDLAPSRWHVPAPNCLASIPPAEYHTAGSPMTFSPDTIGAWVDVDFAALLANARSVAAVSGSRLLPMVKANGYGLGAVEVAPALEAVDPWGFGVASIEEGESLRSAAITRPILVATPLIPQSIPRYIQHDLRPAVGDPVTLDAWVAHGDRPFHLEIDTGMSRAGVRWNDG